MNSCSHRDGRSSGRMQPARPPTIAQSRAKLDLIQNEVNKQAETHLPLETVQPDSGDDSLTWKSSKASSSASSSTASTERTIRLRTCPMRSSSQDNSEDSSESDEEDIQQSNSNSSSDTDEETAPDEASAPPTSTFPVSSPSSSSSSASHRTTSISQQQQQRRASAETFTSQKNHNEASRNVSDSSKRSTMPLPSARGASMLAFTSSSSTPKKDHTPLEPTLSDYVDFDSWQSVDSCDPYGSQTELFNPDGSRKPVLALNMLHRMIGLGVSQRVEGAEALNHDEAFNIQPSHAVAASEFFHQSQQLSPQSVRLYSRIKASANTGRRSKPPSTVYRVNDEGDPI